MPLSKKLEELVDRILHNREKLLQSVSGLSDAQLNHKGEETAWSVSDVLNHVSLVDEANAKLTSNMLKRARAKNLPPDPSPEASVIHSMDEIFARMGAAKFQAPDFVAPHSHSPVDESLTRLKASRERMLANVEQLDGYDLSGLTYPHPFAGELNTYQWVLMAGAHEARHASQINRMKSQPGFPE
ncbi:MAG TPA: DinB family protein [Blastocatellia bacterium]|nr:DinB family protein [Blastocatellia bacterium]